MDSFDFTYTSPRLLEQEQRAGWGIFLGVVALTILAFFFFAYLLPVWQNGWTGAEPAATESRLELELGPSVGSNTLAPADPAPRLQ